MLDRVYGPLTGREWLDVMACLYLEDRLIPIAAKLEEHFGIDHEVIVAWLAEDELDQQAAAERGRANDAFWTMMRVGVTR